MFLIYYYFLVGNLDELELILNDTKEQIFEEITLAAERAIQSINSVEISSNLREEELNYYYEGREKIKHPNLKSFDYSIIKMYCYIFKDKAFTKLI